MNPNPETDTTQTDPPFDCSRCPRLRDFLLKWREKEPHWHNGPVETWQSAEGNKSVELLIVGLAPGLRGANRTGRPFTGDYAGDLLYATLQKFGLASGQYGADPGDGLALHRCAITNSVRCVPPQNKPTTAEIKTCRPYLENTIAAFPNLRALLTLGKIAHDSTLRTLGVRLAEAPFSHGGRHETARLMLFSSYHCSRYNTNTRRLTPEMFESVFHQIAAFLDE